MKKQSGPFKLKYKKSAFPFMENFHVKKHGKLKIERKKSTKDEIYDIKNPIETEQEKQWKGLYDNLQRLYQTTASENKRLQKLWNEAKQDLEEESSIQQSVRDGIQRIFKQILVEK